MEGAFSVYLTKVDFSVEVAEWYFPKGGAISKLHWGIYGIEFKKRIKILKNSFMSQNI